MLLLVWSTQLINYQLVKQFCGLLRSPSFDSRFWALHYLSFVNPYFSTDALEVKDPTINTIILVSSSFVIYIAERYLHDKNLWGFRFFWLLTMAMGSYFLYGQAVEWNSLEFGFTSGVFGGTFYLLTGFHGLHVFTGVLLQGIMLIRSFIPGNYEDGQFGVEATSLFWHFVDVIWIILFILIYVWQ